MSVEFGPHSWQGCNDLTGPRCSHISRFTLMTLVAMRCSSKAIGGEGREKGFQKVLFVRMYVTSCLILSVRIETECYYLKTMN